MRSNKRRTRLPTKWRRPENVFFSYWKSFFCAPWSPLGRFTGSGSRNSPIVVAISPPDRPVRPDPLGDRRALVPISPEMLHVTSIALGNPRLTIVNGKRLAEEDWLVVKTPVGEGSVRVISIQDGFVRFKHGGETIDARLQLATETNAAPH